MTPWSPVLNDAEVRASLKFKAAFYEAKTQREVAQHYAELLGTPGLRMSGGVWIEVNALISGRWPKGLDRVKDAAWKTYEAAKVSP